jgi:hypothetical protein
VIRANLLPRARTTVTAFGLEIDLEHARGCIAGLALAILVGSIGIGIERVRIDGLRGELASEEAAIAERSPERADANRLAVDVARYEEFARAAATFRRSGADAAMSVARVGNALPQAVWLDALDRDAAGFALTGESTSIDAIGSTLSHLALAAPPARADIVSIDAHATDRGGIHFNVRLAMPANGATP